MVTFFPFCFSSILIVWLRWKYFKLKLLSGFYIDFFTYSSLRCPHFLLVDFYFSVQCSLYTCSFSLLTFLTQFYCSAVFDINFILYFMFTFRFFPTYHCGLIDREGLYLWILKQSVYQILTNLPEYWNHDRVVFFTNQTDCQRNLTDRQLWMSCKIQSSIVCISFIVLFFLESLW